MSISPGTYLGRYEIRSLLGAGGMGEVYAARDPKLNRNVAIKVLPPGFSGDAERLRRFEQEASAAEFRGIYRVAAGVGASALVVKTDLFPPFWVHFLPDGRHFLYFGDNGQPKGTGVYLGSLDSSESKLVLPEVVSRVEYAPPGYLLYLREGSLVAQRFDATDMRLSGEPMLVIERMPYFATGWAEFSVSETGILAYLAKENITQLAWFDRKGRRLGAVGEPGEHGPLRLSPDGQ